MLPILSSFGPLLSIILISFAISLGITLIYKFTTNQQTMSSIKSEMNSLRKQMKETKDPAKMGEINSRLMEKTMEQLRASMRPMMITMIPALLVLGWMQGNIAYQQIMPGEAFTATAHFSEGAQGEITLSAPGLELMSPAMQNASKEVRWKLKGNAGRYELEYHYNNEVYTREAVITEKWEYADPVLEKEASFLGISTGDSYPIKKDSQIQRITIDNKPVHPFGGLSIFGWQPGWLGSYIILSLVFSMGLRALLKVN